MKHKDTTIVDNVRGGGEKTCAIRVVKVFSGMLSFWTVYLNNEKV